MAETKTSPSPPHQEEQPNPKRPKLSSATTTSDGEEQNLDVNNPTLPKPPKYKRRKIAIFFAYCGVGYQGMQKNPGAKTIEGDLEEALYLSKAVPEEERGLHRRYDWARSARTDKGVSAVGQVVSGRFFVDPPGFIERLNSNLSPQIRIFGYKRATPAFNAKKLCDRRRYVYLIPVFALDPSCHSDIECVVTRSGYGSELVKCLECSERGRKVFGVMGKRTFEAEMVAETVDVGSGISSNTCSALAEEKIDTETMKVDSVDNSSIEIKNVGASENVKTGDTEAVSVKTAILSKNGTVVEDKIVVNSLESNNSTPEAGNVLPKGEDDKIEGENIIVASKLEKKSNFCYGEEEKERFNRILKYYKGTHNFHNFTTRTTAHDPSAIRYILSFNANTTVNVDGIEFVKCEVLGQSFMLHQIRKMIGLAVAIMRNVAPESLIETAFEKKVNINVPMAPEVGLYLDECFFSSYNNKWKKTHEELSMKDYAEEAEDFKMKYIYSHIASTEYKDGPVALWLHSLNHRNYPDLRFVDNNPSSNEVEIAVDNIPSSNEVENCPSSDVKNNEIANMAE